MSHLIDASSLLNIVRTLGENSVDRLKGQYTISLVYYEVGNAMWKESSILGRLTLEETSKILSFISKLHRHMNIIHPEQEKSLLKRILENSARLNLTYYDSAYLTTAEKLKATLVTDDRQLRAKSKQLKVKAVTSSEYCTSQRETTYKNTSSLDHQGNI